MKHILIAEDEVAAKLALSFALKKAGYKVTSVENGREAYEKIKNNSSVEDKIDLLLTDVQMPEMTGLELIENLVKDDIEIPTLVMTAYGDKSIVVDLMRLGCDEYIDKPFEPKEIITRISRVLDKVERKKQEINALASKNAKEKAELETKFESFKHKFVNLRQQVDSAVGAYQNLIEIDTNNLKVNLEYRTQSLSDLGGDFIGAVNVNDGVNVFIADVAGHDMGASYHTIVLKTLFEENSKRNISGVEFFERLNEQLLEKGKNERMVTGLFMHFDLENMLLETVSAGHPFPVKIQKSFPVSRPIIVEGDVLGIHENVIYDSNIVKIAPGDRFLLHTDGLTNVHKVDGKTGSKLKLSETFLDERFQKYFNEPLGKMIDKIWLEVLKYCNYKYSDDMSLVAIEIPQIKK